MLTEEIPASFERFPGHRARLIEASTIFSSRDCVAGLLLGGSFAYGNPDFYSDIDLYIVVRDEHFDVLFAEHVEIANSLGKPISAFIADHNPGGLYDYIVLYDDFVKVDFIYLRSSQLHVMPKWGRFRVLYDPEAVLSTLVSCSRNLQATFQLADPLVLNQKFRGWCWYVFGKLMRGELWEALEGVSFIRERALLPMINAKNGFVDEGYRRLEKKMDDELAHDLQLTVASYDKEAVFSALLNEITLFRDLRNELFLSLNLTVDPTAEESIDQQMRALWARGN